MVVQVTAMPASAAAAAVIVITRKVVEEMIIVTITMCIILSIGTFQFWKFIPSNPSYATSIIILITAIIEAMPRVRVRMRVRVQTQVQAETMRHPARRKNTLGTTAVVATAISMSIPIQIVCS